MMYVIATMVKPILRILGGNPVHGLGQGLFQRLLGAGLGPAQHGFELAPGCSMGAKSGEYGGRNSRRAPRASTSSAMPATWWTRK